MVPGLDAGINDGMPCSVFFWEVAHPGSDLLPRLHHPKGWEGLPEGHEAQTEGPCVAEQHSQMETRLRSRQLFHQTSLCLCGRRGQCRLQMLREPLCKVLLMNHEMSFWTWKSLLFLCPSLIQACLPFSEALFSRFLQPLKSIGVKHMLQCFQSCNLSFIFLQFLCSSHAAQCMDQSSTNKSACCSLLVCALCQLKPHERSQGNMVWCTWPVKCTQNGSSKARGALCHWHQLTMYLGKVPARGARQKGARTGSLLSSAGMDPLPVTKITAALSRHCFPSPTTHHAFHCRIDLSTA